MDRFRTLSISSFDPAFPGLRRRVIHPKSRAGCQMCKAKKVKCDETKPVCTRCLRNRRDCKYWEPKSRNLAPLPTDDGFNSSHGSTHDKELVHHCCTQWSAIFPGFNQNADFIQAYKSSSLVRNVCHAIAASHLRHLRPGYKPFILREYSHRATAMLEYKQQLEVPVAKLGQSDVNVVLLSAILFGLLAFPLLSATDPSASASRNHKDGITPWISDDPNAEMGWITFQAGLGPLMRSLLPYLPDAMGFLTPIFAPEPGRAGWPNLSRKQQPMPIPWIQFFQLDEDYEEDLVAQGLPLLTTARQRQEQPTLAESVRLLVRITSHLRFLPPITENSVMYQAFFTKAQRDFRYLLLVHDPRAWWLYGYWAGLLCRFQGSLWWCQDRAEQQYSAVRMWLKSLNLQDREEGELWVEMMAELDTVTMFPPREVETIHPR